MIPGYQYHFDDLCIDYYGFRGWGPILATSNIKTEKLREANFKLSEKTFYVDMEYNTFYLPVIDTISYYDLDIYLISFLVHYDQTHNKILFRLHHTLLIHNFPFPLLIL